MTTIRSLVKTKRHRTKFISDNGRLFVMRTFYEPLKPSDLYYFLDDVKSLVHEWKDIPYPIAFQCGKVEFRHFLSTESIVFRLSTWDIQDHLTKASKGKVELFDQEKADV